MKRLPKPYWQSSDGGAVLYHGDCLEILPLLEAGSVDAVVTDPPYGIGFSGSNASTREWEGFDGDDGSLDLRSILNMDCQVIAFGANYYPDQLPHRGRWLCWDKRLPNGCCDAMIGTPFELAWCNRRSGSNKIVRVLHGGVVNADGGKRAHPTQKPILVMTVAIEWISKEGDLILDPFAGSCTTGVAAIRTGRRCILIEKEEKYCAIAAKRMAEACCEGEGQFRFPEPDLFSTV